MKVITYSPEAFIAHAPALFALLCRKVLTEAVDEIGNRWKPYAETITPVGDAAKGDRHPGLMRASWVRYRSRTGFEETRNMAPHGFVIDRGRKRGVTAIGAKRDPGHRKGKVNKRARMLGSAQARQGVTRPVWKFINGAKRAEISQRAIDKAEAAIGGIGS